MCTFTGHAGGVYSVTFSPDGRYALTGSEDTTARLWFIGTVNDLIEYACSRVFRDFTREERQQYDILDDEPTCPQFGTT